MIKFGTKLKQLRIVAGVSQRKLAEAAGIDFTYVSKIENNVYASPSEETLIKMAELLQVEKDYLILLAGKIPSDLKEDLLALPYEQFRRVLALVRKVKEERE